MEGKMTGEALTQKVKNEGGYNDMAEFNGAVKNAVKGEKTPYVLGGDEQKRVNFINAQVRRIEDYMKNIGYVIPSQEIKYYKDTIEALKNGEIDKIPSELLEKIEQREELLAEYEIN